MKLISWYQEIHFLISRNRILDIKKYSLFLDIKKSNSWYQEIDFLISRILFLDIKNSISWYQEFYFLISRNRFLDIKKYFLISKKYFLISRIHFLISRIHFLISRIHFLISRNRILEIKKCLINSNTAPRNWEVHIDTWIGNFKCPYYKPRKTCELLIYEIALP